VKKRGKGGGGTDFGGEGIVGGVGLENLSRLGKKKGGTEVFVKTGEPPKSSKENRRKRQSPTKAKVEEDNG